MARSVARAGLIRPDPYRVSSAVEHREAMRLCESVSAPLRAISAPGYLTT